MNNKPAMAALIVLITLAAISPLHAQIRTTDGGFRIGLAPPQNPLGTPASPNPVQGMTNPPIQGMTTPPILPLGGGIAQLQTTVAPQIFVGPADNGISVLPAGGIIFVPAGTLVVESSLGMQPGTFLSAPQAPQTPSTLQSGSERRGGGTSIQRSNRPTNNDQEKPAHQDVTRLELGTPRDKVIEKYGNPVAFIMNMNGETMYFNGGVVVFIKNGVVASPVN